MIMLIFAAVLLAVSFALTKYYQKDSDNQNSELMMFNAVVGMFSAIIFLAANGFNVHFNCFSVSMALLFGIFVSSYQMIGFKIMQESKMALYTVFLMAGGMILPYIWGLVFLDEQFSFIRTVGILLILASMILSNLDDEKLDLKTAGYCIIVFVLNGFVSIISKQHQMSEMSAGTLDFIITKDIIIMTSCFFISNWYKRKEKKEVKNKLSIKKIIIIFLVAVSSGVSYFLQLKGAENLPATMLYPVVTGGTIIFTAIAGSICFKEYITGKLAISLILCFV